MAPAPASGRGSNKKSPDDKAAAKEGKEAKEAKEVDRRRRRRGGRSRTVSRPEHEHTHAHTKATTKSAAGLFVPDPELRKGRERKGRPVGRYLMGVHVRPELTQIAVLEGRALIEHYGPVRRVVLYHWGPRQANLMGLPHQYVEGGRMPASFGLLAVHAGGFLVALVMSIVLTVLKQPPV